MHALYRAVAAVPGGLARLEDEVSRAYVEAFLIAASERGIGFVAFDESGLLGEIHCYRAGLFCFSHVMSELTIAVHPRAQGRGVGRALFKSLLQAVEASPDIDRVELIARESNRGAIGFYESLGFVQEGEMRGRIRNLDGSVESDIPMAWLRGR